jgi:hypothetical protein
MCVQKGMVGGKRQAVDSAYIKANASMDSLLEKEVMEDGKAFAGEIEANDEDAAKEALKVVKKGVKPEKFTQVEKRKPKKEENTRVLTMDENSDQWEGLQNSPTADQAKETKTFENTAISKESPEIDLRKQVSSQKKKQVDSHHKWQEKAYKDQPKGRKNASEDSFEDEKENDTRKRNKFLSNHTHYSSTDPDARISVKPGKPRQLTFSGQASVDTKQHVITNILADYSDLRDSESVKKIVNQTQENLKFVGLRMEEFLADTGYSSGHSLSYLKFWNITGYIPNFGQYKNSRPGFTYDPEKNHYTCQNGKILSCKGIRSNATNEAYFQLYYSKKSDCQNCPFKATCIGKADAKKLTDTIDKPLYDEMHERLQTRKAKRYKKLRSSTVEPVLGTLINFTGMRRINTRGIDQANKVMIGAAIAYNLRKWLKYSPKPRKKAADLANEAKSSISGFIKSILVLSWRGIFGDGFYCINNLVGLNRLY